MEGLEDEGAEGGAGMRESKAGGIEGDIVDLYDVDVNGTVAVGAVGIAMWCAGAYGAFDRLSDVEKVEGVNPGGCEDEDAEVEKWIGRCVAPGF